MAPRVGPGGGDRRGGRAAVSGRGGRSRCWRGNGPVALLERGAEPAETPVPDGGATWQPPAAFVPGPGRDGSPRAGRAAGGRANARRPQPTTNHGAVRSTRAADLSNGGRTDLHLIPLVVLSCSGRVPLRGRGSSGASASPFPEGQLKRARPRRGGCNLLTPAAPEKPEVSWGSLSFLRTCRAIGTGAHGKRRRDGRKYGRFVSRGL